MTQYIDKSAIVAEIDSILNETNYKPFTNEVLGERNVCKDIKDLLDTLEVIEFQKKKLYVVTRCEEHSDYVEEAFFSEKKAEEYCKQFEGNEDAYGRDITEIEVDCPLEVKEVDLEKEMGKYLDANDIQFMHQVKLLDFAKHFFELGLKAKVE